MRLLCAQLRDPRPPTPTTLVDDAERAASISRILDLVTDEWLGHYNHGRAGERSPDQVAQEFPAKYKAYIPHVPAPVLEPLAPADIQHALGVLKAHKAAALGITNGEARSLWPALAQTLVALYAHAEASGFWPVECRTGFGCLMPKAEESEKAAEQRPLTLLPVWYSVWAKVRLKQLK